MHVHLIEGILKLSHHLDSARKVGLFRRGVFQLVLLIDCDMALVWLEFFQIQVLPAQIQEAY
jgi:hypothetical protein